MAQRFTYRKLVKSYLLWWLFWIAAQIYVLHNLGLALNSSIADSLVSNIFLALIGLVLYNVMRFYQPEKENTFYLHIWVILITVFSSISVNWLLSKVCVADTYYTKFIEQAFPFRFAYNFLMLAFISLMIWMIFYFKNEQENAKRKSDTEKLAREAELTSLRQQLQPHFLFNSLNSISALAGSQPEEARKMIQLLSDFLRGTLRKDDQQNISLKEEIEHLRLYLEIEKVRFGHRLNTNIEIDEKCLEMKLPSLLLQPVVENAIKFGLYDTTEAITINIRTTSISNELIIKVENPYDAETSRPVNGTGFGLSSVERRLFLLFSRNDLLQTETNKNIFITTIKIPQS